MYHSCLAERLMRKYSSKFDYFSFLCLSEYFYVHYSYGFNLLCVRACVRIHGMFGQCRGDSSQLDLSIDEV